jgi:hypothetical protein
MSDIIEKVAENNERGARRQLIEELFYDFHKSRANVYWMNFSRGIFFGFGTILGGTVVVALLVWLLGQFVGFPVIGEYIKQIVEAIQNTK